MTVTLDGKTTALSGKRRILIPIGKHHYLGLTLGGNAIRSSDRAWQPHNSVSAFAGELHDETQHAGANECGENRPKVEPGKGTVGSRTVKQKATNKAANHPDNQGVNASLFFLSGN